jgi:predicted ArsR family transcriptional regulator
MATTDLFSYPHSPGYKARDTARDAAAAMKPKAKTLRDKALAEIRASGHHGLTADEVAGRLGKSIMSIRPRLSELVEFQAIRDTGKRRTNACSGRSAVVWMAL